MFRTPTEMKSCPTELAVWSKVQQGRNIGDSQSYNGKTLLPVTGQNVPMSKCPNVKTSHSQNIPSQNVPMSKRPKSKRPKSKRPRVKTSQVKTSQVYDKFDSYGLQTNGSIYDWLVGSCSFNDSARTFSVMYDHTFPKLANHQIRRQAPHVKWAVSLVIACGHFWGEKFAYFSVYIS